MSALLTTPSPLGLVQFECDPPPRGRPCKKCVELGKPDQCVDVVRKRPGRPKKKLSRLVLEALPQVSPSKRLRTGGLSLPPPPPLGSWRKHFVLMALPSSLHDVSRRTAATTATAATSTINTATLPGQMLHAEALWLFSHITGDFLQAHGSVPFRLGHHASFHT